MVHRTRPPKKHDSSDPTEISVDYPTDLINKALSEAEIYPKCVFYAIYLIASRMPVGQRAEKPMDGESFK
jgi:hypothetical protein